MSDESVVPVTLLVYYQALNRLREGNPVKVPKGSKISVTSVAIEAGRTPGSIKKNRPIFDALIREIKIRAREQQEQSKPGAMQVQQAKDKATKASAKASDYKIKYEAALARELMLLIAWDEATKELRKVAKVVSIKPPDRP